MEMIKEAGVMFGEAAAGAILGPACEGVLESIKKCWMFESPVLDSVKSTVEYLESLIPQMEDHNMKLAGRQDELKELKEQMECGRKLLDELSEVNVLSCFKASYNDQLVAVDASLKSMVGKLRLQLATDVKEVLVLEKENATVVKGTKRKLDEVDETVKAGFLDIQKRQDMLQNMIKKLGRKDLSNPVDLLNEEAALVDALAELEDVAQEVIARSSLDERCASVIDRIKEESYELDDTIDELITRSWSNGWYVVFCHKISRKTQLTFELVEKKTAENKAMVYMPVGEVRDFKMSIKDGVNLLRNCSKVAVWTDELKLEYTNKFIALNKTLEALHNRLAGIRPLQWNCRKCDKSSGTTSTSTSIVDSAGFCH